MNNFLKYFLIYCILFIVCYLGYSFYLWNINPQAWSKQDRANLFLCYIGVCFFYNICLFYYNIGVFGKQLNNEK